MGDWESFRLLGTDSIKYLVEICHLTLAMADSAASSGTATFGGDSDKELKSRTLAALA